MEEIISQQELNSLMETKGEVRGGSIKSKLDFVLEKEGEEGIKKFEESIKKLGFPIKYREIENTKFYPLNILGVTLVLLKKLFNYNDEKFEEIGRIEPKKSSLLVKVFIRYFFSIDSVAKEAPKMWEKAFTEGNLKIPDYSTEKRYMRIVIEDFPFHPIHCLIMKGYLSTLVQMVVKENVECQHTRCPFRGDENQEYLLKW